MNSKKQISRTVSLASQHTVNIKTSPTPVKGLFAACKAYRSGLRSTPRPRICLDAFHYFLESLQFSYIKPLDYGEYVRSAYARIVHDRGCTTGRVCTEEDDILRRYVLGLCPDPPTLEVQYDQRRIINDQSARYLPK